MKPIEKEFSRGVKILIERMKNNPEEFISMSKYVDTPKFQDFSAKMRCVIRGETKLIKDWEDWQVLTKEEQTALIDGFKDMMRERFDRAVVELSLAEPEKYIELSDFDLASPKKITLNPSQIAAIKKLIP